MGSVTTATRKMKVFLVSCFLAITFFSQGWGAKYLVKTADDDEAQFEVKDDDDDNTVQGTLKAKITEDFDGLSIIRKSLDSKNLEKFNHLDKATQNFNIRHSNVVVTTHENNYG